MNLFFKGFLIGIGKIIPGVSGALIAIFLGVYDKMLESISKLYKKENLKFLFLLGMGILTSICLTSNLLKYLLEYYYSITMLFFIGLIIGSITIEKNTFKKGNIIYFIISFLIVMSLCLVKNSGHIITNYSFFNMFLIGLIEALTMIIPGISGTAVMMILGCYEFMLTLFALSLENLKFLIPFGLGTVAGVILISKFLIFLFNKYKDKMNACILGFTLSSVCFLLLGVINSGENILIGFPFLIIGLVLAFLTNRK